MAAAFVVFVGTGFAAFDGLGADFALAVMVVVLAFWPAGADFWGFVTLLAIAFPVSACRQGQCRRVRLGADPLVQEDGPVGQV